MRGRPLLPALLAGAVISAGSGASAQTAAQSWKDVPRPPLRSFSIPRPTRIALPNGMVVLLMEDRELPLVSGIAYIRAGSRYEPAALAGMGEVLSGSWRAGGTRRRTGDELDDYLEARAAKVETQVGMTAATVSLSCLKGDFDDVLAAFLEVLREPAFAEDKIDVATNAVNTGIARRNDDPSDIVDREAMKVAYGADSPYARVPEYATVAAVTREDLLAWHRRYVHPNRMLFGLVGDFDSKAMEARLRKAFASWPRGPDFTDPEPFIQKTPRSGVFLVDKDDVNQSNIRLIHLDTTRKDPDYFALQVVNQILSGNSASRLYTNVRAKKGLAYFVFGGFYEEYDYPGVFEAGMGTKSETTAAGVEALLEEIQKAADGPIAADELARAKDSILNSFVFQFDSKEKVLRQQLAYEYYGYPADFLDRYRSAVEKVTAAEAQAAARRHLHRDRLAIVVVGKSSDFGTGLASFGPVTRLDVAIPPPPAAASP
ncbi:MAG TPA: pitrilysin family protein [Thermoanaerobaculia bacterium]